MPRLLIATSNPGKAREIRALLEPRGWRVLTPAQISLDLDPPETGTTYAENAAIKAHTFAREANMAALADDSGLEVDVLGGRPGVHSARYGGIDLSAEGKAELILRELQAVPEEQRRARFRAAIVIATPDGRSWQTDGVCEGRIAMHPRGWDGFGYDPIFLLPDRGLTMAELSLDEKNRISSRSKAVRAAVEVLEKLRDDRAFREEV